MKAENLRDDRAYLSITLLDKNRRKLRAFRSAGLDATEGWTPLRLGPIDCDSGNGGGNGDGDAKFAVLGLHVEPQAEQEDLRATVSFTDLWFGCLPRLALESNQRAGLLTTAETAEIICTASGFLKPGTEVAFRLEDRLGRLLAAESRPLTVRSKTDPHDG